MFSNDEITLYNVYVENGIQHYSRTYISGVDWQSITATKLIEQGLVSADSVKVFIPYSAEFSGKEFLKPKAFNLSDKSNHFTFKTGDIMVKGIIDFELTGKAPNNLKYLEETYDDVVTIMGVMECDLTCNWEIGAN